MSYWIGKVTKYLPVGKVSEISAAELNDLIKFDSKSVQILDVRTKMEWRSGHISTAHNIPIFNLSSKMESIQFEKDRLVVAICLSAHRSIPAVRLLKEEGYTNVKQLAGGMKAWNKEFKHLLEK